MKLNVPCTYVFVTHLCVCISCEAKFTIIIQLCPEVTTTDYLPVQFLDCLLPSARVLEAHGGCSQERFCLGMAMELDTVHDGYLVADLLQKGALDTLIQTNHKDVPLRGIPLPELVILVRDFQNKKGINFTKGS